MEFGVFRGTENSGNSVLAFHRREKCSEFRTMEQKYKQTLGISFQTIPWKRKQLGIPFGSKAFHGENMLSILFAGTGNFGFESLSQNMAAENVKNIV
jgi:hypothetical protein